MQTLSVKVNKEILDWAMHKVMTLPSPYADLERIRKWMSGEKEPTLHQITDLSNKIHVPFGYFFLDKAPTEDCKLAEFRTIKSLSIHESSRDLIDTIDLMTSAQDWMTDYKKEIGISKNELVGSVKTSEGIETVADRIRIKLGIRIDWFDDVRNAGDAFNALRESIMTLGILVMTNGIVGNNTHRPLDVREFRAFALVDAYAPLIFINTRDTDNGKLFSLLHELVHIFIGEDNLYNDPDGTAQLVSVTERFCNAVAAELLVPDSLFLQAWEQHAGGVENTITELNKKFVCSRFVLLRKALDTGKISKEEYGRLQTKYQKQFQNKPDEKGGKQKSGGDYYKALNKKWDRAFIQALYASARSGRTSYRDVYRLTNTTGKSFQTLAGMAGGV